MRRPISLVLEEVIKKTWQPADPQTESRQLEATHPFPVLGMCFCLPSWLPEAALRIQPWDRNVVLRLIGLSMWPNPLEASIETFKILVGGRRNLLVLGLPKSSLLRKFPCSLKLPPSSMGQPASFFRLSLASVYGGQFQITISGKLPKMLQSNNWI